MWLIVEVDVELEYPNVYGPFDSKQAATDALPRADKTGTVYWHVTELEPPTGIVHELEPMVDLPAPKNPLEELLDTYGAVENVPAPNSQVYFAINRQLADLRALIKTPHHDPEAQAHRLAQLLYLEELALVHRPRVGF